MATKPDETPASADAEGEKKTDELSSASPSTSKYSDVSFENKKPKTNIEVPQEVAQEWTTEDQQITDLVKKKYGDVLNELYPDTIVRFVRGYAHEEKREEATYERIDHYLKRYKEFNFDTIADEEWKEEPECAEAWRCFTYGEDHQGHPVMYDEIGSSDPTQVEKVFKGDMDMLRKFRFRFMRRVQERKLNLSRKHGVLIYKHVMVMDMYNFSSSHFGQKYRQLASEIIGEEQHLFPETAYKIFIVNTPWPLRLLWKLVSSWIDPITVKKITVTGGSFLTELQEVVDINQIPEKYGGKGKWELKLAHDAEDYANSLNKSTPEKPE